jgi:competence protein ComEA
MFNQLKNHLINVFGISSTEARGIIVIFALITLILCGSLFIPVIFSEQYDNYLSDRDKLDSLIKIIESDTLKVNSYSKKSNVNPRGKFYPFDPNSVQLSELDSMGFPDFISERMIKFRKSGGRFLIRNDLMNIYGMSEEFYLMVKPYIILPDSVVRHHRGKIPETIKLKIEPVENQFDINKADSAVLKSVHGIGPVLAGRIIKYRSLLGGYVSKDQFNEIYGIKDTVLLRLKASCFIDELFVAQHIKINFAEWKDLARHPYLGKNIANQIIKYRDASGPFQSIEDLKELKDLNDSLISRLQFYLEF